MGDIMAQIGQYKLLINMIGTAQANRTGAAVKEEAAKMKIGTYKSVLFQKKNAPLLRSMVRQQPCQNPFQLSYSNHSNFGIRYTMGEEGSRRKEGNEPLACAVLAAE